MYKGQYYTRQTANGRWHIFQVTFATALSVSAIMLHSEPSFLTEKEARNRIRQLNAQRFAHHVNK